MRHKTEQIHKCPPVCWPQSESVNWPGLFLLICDSYCCCFDWLWFEPLTDCHRTVSLGPLNAAARPDWLNLLSAKWFGSLTVPHNKLQIEKSSVNRGVQNTQSVLMKGVGVGNLLKISSDLLRGNDQRLCPVLITSCSILWVTAY